MENALVDLSAPHNEKMFLKYYEEVVKNLNSNVFDDYQRQFIRDTMDKWRLLGNQWKPTRKQWNYLRGLWEEIR